MGLDLHLSVLQERSPQSHTWMRQFWHKVDVPAENNVGSLVEVVRKDVKSHLGKSWVVDVDDIDFVAYQLPQNLQGLRKQKKQRIVEMADSGRLDKIDYGVALESFKDSSGLIFVFEAIPIRFVLFRVVNSSYECLEVERTTALPVQTVGVIEQAAQDCIKAILGPALEVDVQVWEPPQPFELSDDGLSPRSKEELGNIINEEYMGYCPQFTSDLVLRDITHREHLIITFTLRRFKLFLFERGPSPYPYIGFLEVEKSPDSLVQVLEQAAEEYAKEFLSKEGDPALEILVDRVSVYEPRSSYEDAYNKPSEQMVNLEIDNNQLARTNRLTSTCSALDPLSGISSLNLIVECVVTRRRKLQFNCALFERKPGSFGFAGRTFVEAFSGQTMKTVWDAASSYIESHLKHGTNTKYRIQVYKPTEAFETAYGKAAWDLSGLKLEEHHFKASPVQCVEFLSQQMLPDAEAYQTLIVVFDVLIRPSPALSEMFLGLKIVNDAPTMISKLENYRNIQRQPLQRILDDRPHTDGFVPPLSLLYDGFGLFDDVLHERGPVPGESSIFEVQLWKEVNTFATRMAKFYGSEAERQAVVIRCLEDIFSARSDSDVRRGNISTNKICSHLIISDGHVKGAHGAIIFCVECKNEISGISCEPSVELVSYVASSFKEELNMEHQDLFHGWRVPALGMIQIGTFVQFWGTVMLAPNMRVAPLTPMLPLATPADDEQSRRSLFLAFKAASIVLFKIQADAQRLVQETPPEIPLELRRLPSVTGIEAVTATSPPSRINFTLVGRHDTNIENRNLYHALLDSTNEEIYVKFTRRYSRNLHDFCAARGLAPKLLGFERLPGGWFGLAMEKIDIMGLSDIAPSEFAACVLELETWKKDIGKLVEDFHREDLVHGDLRLANFIFTKDRPCRMLLADFDWGGKAEEVYFPRGELAAELYTQDGQHGRLDRAITKVHDDMVLAGTFRRLDEIAAHVAMERAERIGET